MLHQILSTIASETEKEISDDIHDIQFTVDNLFDVDSLVIADKHNAMSKKDFRDLELLFHSILFYTKFVAEGGESRVFSEEGIQSGATNNFFTIKKDDVRFFCDYEKYAGIFDEVASRILFDFAAVEELDIEDEDKIFDAKMIAKVGYKSEDGKSGYEADVEDNVPPISVQQVQIKAMRKTRSQEPERQ